jgi:hypothetical protein
MNIVSLRAPKDREVIISGISFGDSRASLSEIVEIDGFKLRLYVLSGGYQEDCEARVSVWMGQQWSDVHRLEPQEMKTKPGLYFRDNVTRSEFAADADALINIAMGVLA